MWFLLWHDASTNIGPPVRWSVDTYDLAAYYDRGSWFPDRVPYRDTASEYPQVATYLFGLARIATFGAPTDEAARGRYLRAFSLAMLVVLFVTILLLDRMSAGRRQLWMLLPASLYFTMYRYDILPALMILTAFYLAQERRWRAAAFMLAVGTMTKWVPLLLLPSLVVYASRVQRRIAWQAVLIFVVTCIAILLPTLLLGGLDGVLVPYKFHAVRGLESISLPTAVSQLLDGRISDQVLMLGFSVLSVSAAGLSVLLPIDRPRQLLCCWIVIVAMFIACTRIYSPQWMLWLFPLLILGARSRFDDVIIGAYGVQNYFGFPVAWESSLTWARAMNAVTLTILAAIVLRFAWALWQVEGGRSLAGEPGAQR
jgi:hypothetical protein